jgi:hypothetical protein
MAKHPYFGETACMSLFKGSKRPCNKKAYFAVRVDETTWHYRCGMHSKRAKYRIKLKRNPHEKENRERQLRLEKAAWKQAAAQNDGRGQLRCQKMRMMKLPETPDGFRLVFPNNRHGNRTDGIGCCWLSPMRMGPVDTKQPGLPNAMSIENAHQFNKVFPEEVGDDGQPLPRFFQTQHTAYLDPVPHRHKQEARGKNVPLYSLWIDQDGNSHRITYFESRQFYCNWYERIATGDPAEKGIADAWRNAREEYQTLLGLLDSGHNLCIVGYDGYNVDKTLEEHYLDTKRPFGHEMVLYTLLAHPKDPSKWPWRKYTTFDF